MPNPFRLYVHYVDAFNTAIGKVVMYVIFLLMALLLFAALGRTLFGWSLIWTVESAQFTMTAYYIIGGAYSLILHGHVRMDLLYSRLPRRRQAVTDAITDLLLIFYLVVMLIGAVASTRYAIEYGQTSRSSWRPPLAPIKIIMTAGLVLMFLQVLSTFFKDVARAIGRPLDAEPADE